MSAPWAVIAETGGEFRSFGPYVASLDDRGTVAFQATLRSGGTGLFTGTGDGATTRVASVDAGQGSFDSHPDIDDHGALCGYFSAASGQSVVRAGGGSARSLAATGERFARIGPLGPTANARGEVAFRAQTRAGRRGVYVAREAGIVTVAEGERFVGFHGLPVLDARGAVLCRADLAGGTQALLVGDGGAVEVLVETGSEFVQLGAFPSTSARGRVVFAATRAGGAQGLYALHDGEARALVESGARFESVRGGMANDDGTLVYYATPRGGRLGVYRDHALVLALGGALSGSVVTDFALNPVSLNVAGQLALRVALASGRELLVRV